MAPGFVSPGVFVASSASVAFLELLGALLARVLPASSRLALVGFTRFAQSACLFLILRAGGKGAETVGLKRHGIRSGLAKGVIWGVGFGTVVAGTCLLLWAWGWDPFPLLRTELPPGWGRDRVGYFLVGVLVSPFAEEVYFRGIAYGFLKRWGKPAAICVSSLLFAFSHPAGQRLPLIQFVGGLLFALAYEREGNLVVPLVLHGAGNLFLFVLSL